jgi:hypothetical protein
LGGLDLALGTHETYRHRRFGYQEGSCDLLGRQAAEQSEGERHLGFRGESRVAAGEDEAKPVVVHGVYLLGRAGVVALGQEDCHLTEQLPPTQLPAQAIDRALAGRGCDPPSRVGGRPSTGHLRKATVNASCTASSAASISAKTRVKTATERPYSSRKMRPIAASSSFDSVSMSCTNQRLGS